MAKALVTVLLSLCVVFTAQAESLAPTQERFTRWLKVADANGQGNEYGDFLRDLKADGLYVNAVEGRWHNNRAEFHVRVAPYPDDTELHRYWWFGMPEDFYNEKLDELTGQNTFFCAFNQHFTDGEGIERYQMIFLKNIPINPPSEIVQVHKLADDQGNGGLSSANFTSEAEALLSNKTSKKIKARVYEIVAGRLSQDMAKNRDLAITYLDKALACGVPLPAKTQLMIYRGNAEERFIRDFNASDFGLERYKSASLYLQALKIVDHYLTIQTRQSLPGVNRYTVLADKDDPEFKAAIMEHGRQLEARRSAELQNQLLGQKEILMERVTFLYSKGFQSDAELFQIAGRILNNPELTQSLVEKARARRATLAP